MFNIRRTILIVAAVLILLPGMTAGCFPTTDGGYSQGTIDADVTWGLIKGMGTIFNQNIAGTATGQKDLTVGCPLGGEVHITGSTSFSQSTNISTVDLVYDMNACEIREISSDNDLIVDLTVSGAITETGSWNSDTDFVSKNGHSDSLAMTGDLERPGNNATAVVDQTCAFAVSITTSGITGQICDRDVAW